MVRFKLQFSCEDADQRSRRSSGIASTGAGRVSGRSGSRWRPFLNTCSTWPWKTRTTAGTDEVYKNGSEMESVPVRSEKVGLPHSAKKRHFVEDFGSMAEYLDYLDKNDTAYLEYFKWRTLDFTKLPSYRQAFQHYQLCRLMHGINVDYLHYSKNLTSIEKLPLFGYKTRNAGSIYDWMNNRE